MMLQNKSSRMAWVKCLYAIPTAVVAALLLASPALAETTKVITEVKITNYFDSNQTDTPPVVYGGDDIDEISVKDLSGSNSGETRKKPHIIINGEYIPGLELNAIDADKVESIELVKGSDSYEKYSVEVDRSEELIIIKLKAGESVVSVTLTQEEIAKKVFAKKDEPYLRAEKMPTFGDGGALPEFRQWVMMQLKYPDEARLKGVSGIVLVSFIVDTDGSVTNIECMRTPDESLYKEVERILKKSPKWTPAMQNGEIVKVTFKLPVKFSL